MAEGQALLPDPSQGPRFTAGWSGGPSGAGTSGSGNINEGTYGAAGAPLFMVLGMAWDVSTAREDARAGLRLRSDFIDVPDSLRYRPVNVSMVQPGLSREDYGRFLLRNLGESLGLDIYHERRPSVVYVLRQRSGAALALTPSDDPDARTRMWSRDSAFTSQHATPAELAANLGSALGHIVVDETGLDGRYNVELAFPADAVDLDVSPLTSASIDVVRAMLAETTGLELVPEVRPAEWMVVRARRDG